MKPAGLFSACQHDACIRYANSCTTSLHDLRLTNRGEASLGVVIAGKRNALLFVIFWTKNA